MPEIVEGVYIEVIKSNIGTGSTSRSQEIKNLYRAHPISHGRVKLQLLDDDGLPLNVYEEVEAEEFTKRFTHLPDFKPKEKKTARELTVDKALAQAEAHYRRKQYNSAEFEYGKALKLDEDNVRANFGVGKVYLATGDTEKAKATFKKLAKIDAVFETENKHIFNELGIELRRLGLYNQAIEYYTKAISFTSDDENLYFNMARALFENGETKKAVLFLKKAVQLRPKMPEAIKLYETIKKSVQGGS